MPGQVLTYPWAAVKLTNGVATWLHFDHLGSVRAITDATGAKVESAIYRPFGEQSEWLLPGNPSAETKGWIGERYDADAGLQYLNARYYDPALGMFLQPDWFEVTKLGVGTNRFSYSFNDPVNKIDPGGNEFHKMTSQELQAEAKRRCKGSMLSRNRFAGKVLENAARRPLGLEENRRKFFSELRANTSTKGWTNTIPDAIKA